MILTPPVSWIIFFVFGICLGSFINVVVIRLPRGRSIFKPSSRCGFCRSSIRPWQNLPLLSFLISGGSCGQCGNPYSIRYFVVELLMGVIAIGIGSVYGASVLGVWFLLFSGLLVAVSFIDLELRIIPDSLSLGAWAVSLIIIGLGIIQVPYSIFGLGPFLSAALSSIIGYGSLWILGHAFYFLKREEGLGGGDVKLMGLIGAILGVEGVMTTLLVGSLLGTVVGGYFMFIKNKTKHFPFPFGPFLAMGALVSVFGLSRWLFQ